MFPLCCGVSVAHRTHENWSIWDGVEAPGGWATGTLPSADGAKETRESVWLHLSLCSASQVVREPPGAEHIFPALVGGLPRGLWKWSPPFRDPASQIGSDALQVLGYSI